MSRLSGVHVQTFVRLCPDHRAFTILSCVNVQTFVRSSPDFRAFMSRPSCVHHNFLRSCPDFPAFMSKLSCVHVHTIVLSSVFPDHVILNARRLLRAFNSAWAYRTSVWDMSLVREVPASLSPYVLNSYWICPEHICFEYSAWSRNIIKASLAGFKLMVVTSSKNFLVGSRRTFKVQGKRNKKDTHL